MSKSPIPRIALLLVFAFLVASLPAAADSAGAALDWYRVPASRAAALDLAGADRVVDYGSYLWVGTSASRSGLLRDAGFAAASFELDLGGQRFDPARDVPEPAEGWIATADGEGLRLVQVLGPTRREWLDEIGAAGLEVLQYVHPFTYVVWGRPAPALADAAGIRWVGRFEPAYKVLPQNRALGTAPTRLSGLVVRRRAAETVAALVQLGATDVEVAAIDPAFTQLKLTLPGDRLAEAAGLSGVYALKPQPTDGGLRGEMSDQVNAGNYDGSNVAFLGYETWLSAVGVDGSGVIVADVDSGVFNTHADLVGRMLPCVGSTCGGATSSSHGTHTAGIIAADGSSGVTANGGFLRGLGVAPGANLVEQLYSPTYTQPGGMLTLIEQSHQNGASLSGNSWGPSGSPEGYDDDTRQVDVGVRDADDDEPGNQPFTYVLSFMNGNGGTSTQGSPDEAKNLFNIGSTKMQTGSGAQILDIFDVSSNSAHGPALDGRTIPHMVAPGCSVDSTLPAGHGLLCGTSMASPHVAGAVALFFQFWREQLGRAVDPTPAMVKAAFLPVAHDLAGHLDADGGTLGHPFDSKQGWGRLSLDAVVDPAVAVEYHDAPAVLGASGEQWEVTTEVASATDPVRIMLVWTDAPGHGLGGSTPAWNNDLDLVVEAGGETYLGNDFGPDGESEAGGVTPDGKNNTEGVFLPAGTTGGLTIRVEAANVSSDGIPGEGDTTDQDFAVVCYNCATTPLFADGFESADVSAWSITVP